MAKMPKSAVPDLADLTDADPAELDTWIEAHLPRPEDGDERGDWTRRLCRTDPSRLVGNSNPTRYMNIHATAEFAATLGQLARERNMSREAFIKVVLAHTVSRLTGRPMEEVLRDMPPQRRGVPRDQRHLPSKPEGRPRKEAS